MQFYDETEYVSSVVKRAVGLSKLFSLKYEKDFEKFAVKHRLQPRHIKFLQEVWQMLEEIYPGRGDIHFELEPQFKVVRNTYGSNHVNQFTLFNKFTISTAYIVIYWPEVTIKNGKRQSITIKNLFTRIPVELDSRSTRRIVKFTSKIQGLRTSITPTEYNRGYAHSHLPSRAYNDDAICEWANFCTGQGDINFTTSMLNNSTDMDMIKLLLLQLEPFLQWESLEGRPYIRLANIVNSNYDLPIVTLRQCANYYNIFIRRIIAHGKTFDLNWKLENGKFVIIDDEKFNTLLVDTNQSSDNCIVYKDERGQYFVNKNVPERMFMESEQWIPFRGEKIYFKVEGEFKESTEGSTKYLHPKFKNYVKQQLELKANKLKIRNSILGTQN